MKRGNLGDLVEFTTSQGKWTKWYGTRSSGLGRRVWFGGRGRTGTEPCRSGGDEVNGDVGATPATKEVGTPVWWCRRLDPTTGAGSGRG